MAIYKDLGGDSGVLSYEIGDTFIDVTFKNGHKYQYNYMKPGEAHVQRMKSLANIGEGLNEYINKYVKYRYAKKY